MEDSRLERLVNASKKFKKFEIYTSAECYGPLQEFVRDGFEWDVWEKNMFTLNKVDTVTTVNIMMTISALSIWGVAEFLEKIVEWRQSTRPNQYYMSLNILRFPSFQSVNIIDQKYKDILADRIENTLENIKDVLQAWEINQITRLIKYLRNVTKSYEDNDGLDKKLSDFKSFVTQYATRRDKPIEDYFTKEMFNWYKTI